MEWLGRDGRGAQGIIVDNTPPGNADDHVRVRYTRNPTKPPFGLIDNEIGHTSEGDGDTARTAKKSSTASDSSP